ncbi:hypothetical protein ROZALSC1DRAFT_31373 [Rozella allomycis CSF55]|uniref:S5 DRBM domain-containing protein n=1 Tax=Rozella allomycis (strain CSF55) TaxID=988480 RepID=A0A075ASX0_ROZAC|nr:hypothetical protein O9G_000304 [Rozella allomycis CSF55]RKP16759.1 hypothetical protein ROZALSC1DRAFT_31373 [Rozella allomycis CSF55]|eukprot:EPZ31825.1 hypothetical protein O9G_000304 [Rozella allomycis CSF55]
MSNILRKDIQPNLNTSNLKLSQFGPRKTTEAYEVRERIEYAVILSKIIKRRSKTSKKGFFWTFSAAGNGKGAVGVGIGRDEAPSEAIRKSFENARKNMELVWAAPPKHGVRAHHAIQNICKVAGIRDLGVRTYGSKHPMNVAYGFMEALRKQKTPEQMALDSGLKVIELNKAFYLEKSVCETLRNSRTVHAAMPRRDNGMANQIQQQTN